MPNGAPCRRASLAPLKSRSGQSATSAERIQKRARLADGHVCELDQSRNDRRRGVLRRRLADGERKRSYACGPERRQFQRAAADSLIARQDDPSLGTGSRKPHLIRRSVWDIDANSANRSAGGLHRVEKHAREDGLVEVKDRLTKPPCVDRARTGLLPRSFPSRCHSLQPAR